MASGGEKRKGSLRYFGEKGQNASRTGTTFSFLLSEGVQKKKKKGLLSHDSLRLVVGGRKQRVFAENDRHGEAGEKGEQQFDERCVASLVVLLYVSFFFFFFPVVFSPPGERPQNFLGPQADACFGATPVPNVGKSSALLMSGAWRETDECVNRRFQLLLLCVSSFQPITNQ